MTASMWVVFGAMEGAFLFASWRARQFWSNSTRVFDDVDNVRMRSFPLVVVSGAVAVGLVMILGSVPDRLIVLRAVLAAMIVLIVSVSSFLWVAIRYRGRPTRLIPPHLRRPPRRRTRQA